MAQKVTFTEFAKVVGVSPSAISHAVRDGRLTADGKLLDLVGARAQWETNRQRRRRTRPAPGADQALPADGPPGAAGDASAPGPADGASFWEAKTRRERAEASMAELKEAELRRDLVRRAVVERELASRLVALREALESLADRLGALLAAEGDTEACRRLLRNEHRLALAGFAELMLADRPGCEADQGAVGRAT